MTFNQKAFLIEANLVGIKWYHTEILTCIPLMTNDVEHFLCISLSYVFLGDISIQILCPSFNWVICLFILGL